MENLPYFQIVFTFSALAFYFIANRIIHSLMHSLADFKKVSNIRVTPILKYFNIIIFLIILIAVLAVWGIDYRGLLVLASSILAVLGVALFAQWSLLSNITAGVIIFFSFPARIGDKVEIIDGSTTLTGTIIEINIFQILLRDEKGFDVSYPNSLIFTTSCSKTRSARECYQA